RLQIIQSVHPSGNACRDRGVGEAAGLSVDYLHVDLGEIASGLGAETIRATSAEEIRTALNDTRTTHGPVAIIVPTVPLVDLPGSEVFWDVAPAEVAEQEWVGPLRTEY